MATKGNGRTIQWIRDHQAYQHDDWCLIWPFSTIRGYGNFVYLQKRYYAHRFMCEIVHGAPPTPKHQAAHSCGSGHLGCVNPRHLSWKTQSENQLDCREHGTQAKTAAGNRGIITLEQAQQIRLLKGVKLQWEVAAEYGISESTVSDIWQNRTHARPSKIIHWTHEEDEKIRDCVRRGLTFTQMATEIGKPYGAVMGRTYRLGLTSGRLPTRQDFALKRS